MDVHREQMLRGYLAMLVVEKPYRSLGTGKPTTVSTPLWYSLCSVFASLRLFVSCKQQHTHGALQKGLLTNLYMPYAFMLVQALALTIPHRQHCPWPQSSIVLAWHAGTELVKLTVAEMIKGQCEEVVLEAEVTNSGALALYQNLGFIRDKSLHRYQSLSSLQACHAINIIWLLRHDDC